MAKGKGEVKGWITRNGVHIPIYDHYTVREGHEPGEHGVKGKFKPKSRTEQMRSNIERDLHSKLMTYWRGDERFVKSSLRDSMEKVDTMLEYFKENKKNFIEPSADYPRDIVWRFSGKDKHTGKHAGFEFDSYPRESDARETLRGNGYTVNNGIIFPKPIFQYLMDKTNVEDTDIDVAKAVMKQALKEYKSDKGIKRGKR